MLAIKSQLSPTLVDGAVAVAFGQFEKVDAAMVALDLPDGAAAGLSFKCATAISGRIVTVTITKVTLTEATDANRVYAAAVTADVDGRTLTVIANGY